MRVESMFGDSNIWPELSGSDHCPAWADVTIKGDLASVPSLPAFSTRNTFTGAAFISCHCGRLSFNDPSSKKGFFLSLASHKSSVFTHRRKCWLKEIRGIVTMVQDPRKCFLHKAEN